MGTGGKSSHQAYDVAPTDAGNTPPEPTDGQTADTTFVLPEAFAQVQTLTGEPVTDPADTYEQLVKAAAGCVDGFAGSTSAAHDAVLSAAVDDAHAQMLAWLQQLTPEQLQQLAAAQGFTHPQLVGLSGKQPHPLVHWLDPFYPAGIPSKGKIQEVANARYAALAAGETINGLTLADLPPPADPSAGTWTATVSDVVGLQAEIATALADMPYAKYGMSIEQIKAVDAGLVTLVELENKLATATCPDAPQALTVAQAAATHSINQALTGKIQTGSCPQLREAAVASGMLTAEQMAVLSTKQVIAAARRATPAGEAAEVLQVATERAGQVAARQEAIDAHKALVGGAFKPGDTAQWDALGQSNLAQFATLTGDFFAADAAIKKWSGVGGVPTQAIPAMGAEAVTLGFRQWAKTQPLGQLRQSAAALGLEHADQATRAQVQNYIAGQWDPKHEQKDVQALVAAKVQAKAAGPSVAAAATSATQPGTTGGAGWQVGDLAGGKAKASKTPGPVTPTPTTVPAPVPVKGSGWAAQHANLVAALKHSAASSGGLPPRMDGKVVASFDFGKGSSGGHLGGTYAKSLHTGPDGKPWMFKTDSSGGARAAAEADAAAVFAAAGLPAVPVYRTTVGGKTGSVQPLVTQADHFPTSPTSWSQADTDAIVRYHVAAWAVSNHDGHTGNLLRTPTGGMVAIDLGQAYKFCDKDKLSLSYNPVGNTVTHTLYHAHQSGSLPKGVTVNPAAAHPVLSAIEKIPDSQWRAMLHDTAHTGVKAGVAWTAAMRERAAKTHGVTADKVSTAQVAEAFLDAAVERKKGLRQSFATFFVGELKLASATALLKGGQ